MFRVNLEKSWLNEKIAEEQFKLNVRELDGPYPEHWTIMLDFLDNLKETNPELFPGSLLDIGCGVGTISKLLERHHPEIAYCGIDYSSSAIEIAKKVWTSGVFEVKDYWDLTKQDLTKHQIINAAGFHNILQDGDEALEWLLTLNPKVLLLEKLKLTSDKCYYKRYKAYNEIETCMYYHNREDLIKMFRIYGYTSSEIQIPNGYSHFLLRKLS